MDTTDLNKKGSMSKLGNTKAVAPNSFWPVELLKVQVFPNVSCLVDRFLLDVSSGLPSMPYLSGTTNFLYKSQLNPSFTS